MNDDPHHAMSRAPSLKPARFPVELETNRLVLREANAGDIPFFYALVHNEEAARYQIWRYSTDINEYGRIFMDALEESASPRRTTYELVVTIDHQPIGYCGFMIDSADDARAELFYAYIPDAWGRGYASEAAIAMSDFALDDVGVHRLWATAHPSNIASQRVLEKCGMTQEGVMRNYRYMHGEWADRLLYARIND